MDDTWIYLTYLSLPWLLPVLVLVGVLGGGAALGAVIVAIVGAVRTGVGKREEPGEDADVEEFFAGSAG